MSDNVSITEAATRLGLNRSTLSKLLSECGVKRTQAGRLTMVSYSAAQEAVQQVAAQGRLKVKGEKTRDSTGHSEQLVELLKSELRDAKERERALREQYDVALDKVESLLHLEGEMKLLRGANEQLKNELDTVKSKQGLVGRIGKAIDILRKGE